MTPWFVRATLPADVPAETALKNVLHGLSVHGVSVRRFGTSTDASGAARGAATVHALTNARAPGVVQAAAEALRTTLGAAVAVFRVLDE